MRQQVDYMYNRLPEGHVLIDSIRVVFPGTIEDAGAKL